jgi:hypothetical protein
LAGQFRVRINYFKLSDFDICNKQKASCLFELVSTIKILKNHVFRSSGAAGGPGAPDVRLAERMN